jgi:hypothetical protein
MTKLILGGWQRLGITLSVSLIVMVFAYVAYEVRTTPPSIERKPSVFDDLPSDEDRYFIMFAPDKTLRMAELTKPSGEIRRAVPYMRAFKVRNIIIAIGIPLAFIWLLVPGSVRVYRWIRAGFRGH